MIKIVDVMGLASDAGEYKLLDKRQQQYIAMLVRDFLKKEDVKAKVIVE